MKKKLLWGIAILVLGVVNGLVISKEHTLAQGETMLLELAPVDPRSLIQGDYMELRYAMARDVDTYELDQEGCIVVTLDDHQVATFVRIHNEEPLAPGERLLFYRNRNGLKLGAESFMFQEGLAEIYENGHYGELKVDASGKSVLVGLRDWNYRPLSGESDGDIDGTASEQL